MPGKGLNPYQQYYWNASNAYDLAETACVSIGFVLEGELDVSALSRAVDAVDAVVNRHEQLNSLFRETAEGVRRFPQAAVHDVLRVGNEAFEMSGLDASIEALCQIPLGLKTDIPFRAYLNPVDHERYLLALIIHHIVVDSWSLEVILDDLGNAYNQALRGAADPLLAPLTFDHEILAEPLKPDERQRQVQFWRDYLRNAKIPRIPGLGVAESAQAKSTFDVLTPSREIHEALNQLCSALDVTPFVVYTAAASIALARFCASDDLLIQTNVTPRWEEGRQTVVSYLSARIPLRIRVDSAMALQAHILSVADSLYETFENVSLSIGDMMTESGIKESLPIHIGAENPFESWNLQNVAVSQVQFPDYQPWPLFLWVPVSSEHSFIKLQYQADRMSADDIAMLKRLLIETLERCSLLSQEQHSRDPEASSHAAAH